MRRPRIVAMFVLVVGLAWTLGPATAIPDEGVETIAEVSPFTRGIEVAPNGAVTVAANVIGITPEGPAPIASEFIRLRNRRTGWQGTTIATYPEGIVDIANKAAGNGSLFAITGGPELGGSAGVVKWNPDEPLVLADMVEWREANPDPTDLEGVPDDTNQWAVAPVGDGSVLVADAGGNEVVRVHTDGTIESVAHFNPVPSQAGAGFPPVSEAVPTSVAVGPDGGWYVGQLVGFPGTPGSAAIWRIDPGTTDAVCDVGNTEEDPCSIYEDGFTSIMDIDWGSDGSLYVLELSKLGWFALEVLGLPGADEGALIKVDPAGSRTELAAGEILVPGGMAAGDDGHVYVVTNFLGTLGSTADVLRIAG